MKKRITCLLLMLALIVSSTVTPNHTKYAKADSKAYMKSLGVKWDLKKNKSISYTEYFFGVGKQKYSLKMTDYKITDAAKDGYKKLSFSLTIQLKWTPSKEQVDKVINTMNKKETDTIGGGHYYAVVDYNSGLDLEEKNDYGITAKTVKAKASNVKKYKGTNDRWIKLAKTQKYSINVIYPQDYDGLCIGFGGHNAVNLGAFNKLQKQDDKFWSGKTPFGKTSYYKKGKKNSHWMRVRASKNDSTDNKEDADTDSSVDHDEDTDSTDNGQENTDSSDATEYENVYCEVWCNATLNNSDTGYAYTISGIEFKVSNGNYTVDDIRLLCEEDPHCINLIGELEAISGTQYDELYDSTDGSYIKDLIADALNGTDFISLANTTVSWCPVIKLELRMENDEFVFVPIAWDEDFAG